LAVCELVSASFFLSKKSCLAEEISMSSSFYSLTSSILTAVGVGGVCSNGV